MDIVLVQGVRIARVFSFALKFPVEIEEAAGDDDKARCVESSGHNGYPGGEFVGVVPDQPLVFARRDVVTEWVETLDLGKYFIVNS